MVEPLHKHRKELIENHEKIINKIDIISESYLLNSNNTEKETHRINEKRIELITQLRLIFMKKFAAFIDYKPSFTDEKYYFGKIMVHDNFLSKTYLDTLRNFIVELDLGNKKNLTKLKEFDRNSIEMLIMADYFLKQSFTKIIVVNTSEIPKYMKLKFDSVLVKSLNFSTLSKYLTELNQNKIVYMDFSCKCIELVQPNQQSHIEFESLKTIDLSCNNIKHLEKDCFISLSNVEELNLSDNLINDLKFGWSNGLSNLKILDLRNNRLKKISTINLNSLEVLLLDENEIEQIDNDNFNSLLSLKILSLRANKIKKIEESMFNGLKQLQELNLNSNNISIIEDECFNEMTNLKRLDLSSNHLKNIQIFLFKYLNILNILVLCGNQNMKLERDFFNKIKSLKVLFT